jgi:hypothetical protein
MQRSDQVIGFAKKCVGSWTGKRSLQIFSLQQSCLDQKELSEIADVATSAVVTGLHERCPSATTELSKIVMLYWLRKTMRSTDQKYFNMKVHGNIDLKSACTSFN